MTKVLKGIHTIVMESGDGFQVQGFIFKKPQRELSEICALDAESIYGDKFAREEDAVTGIGNNVMLNFGEFDFTKEMPVKIEITGRSKLPQNSIHIIFDGDTKTRVLAEFEGAEDYRSRTFVLSGIEGKCNVSFAFLPGSDFDFKAFRFVFV
ncbi:MAG: hypothetical protein K2P50_12255 [Lachnospiraceae bacterium]|nr:hypothetical protein [Lachnospiraceae bacterium]